MRTRTKGGFTYAFAKKDTVKDCGSPETVTTYPSVPILQIGDYWVCNDVVTPGFAEASKRGSVISNPCTITRNTKTVKGQCNLRVDRTTPCGTGTQYNESTHYGSSVEQAPSLLTYTSDEIESFRGAAYTSAVAKAAAEDWQSLVDLVELEKTAAMFKNVFKDFLFLVESARRDLIRDTAKRAKRGLPPGYKDTTDFITKNWLQYQFGFMPLTYSLKGIMQAALRRKSPPRASFHAHEYAQKQDSVSNQLIATGSYAKVYMSYQRKVEIKAHGSILVEPHLDWIHSVGMEMTDVPSAAWELVPWSFVIDWFTNVGDIIRAATISPNITTLASSGVVKVTSTTTWQRSLTKTVTDGSLNYGALGSMSGEVVSFTYDRIPDPSYYLHYTPPSFTLRDARHAVDALALAIGHLRSR